MIRKRIFKKSALIVWLLLTDQNSTKFIILVVPCDKMVHSYSNGQSNGKYWRLLQRPVEREVLAVLQRPVETEVKGMTTQKDTLYLLIFLTVWIKAIL